MKNVSLQSLEVLSNRTNHLENKTEALVVLNGLMQKGVVEAAIATNRKMCKAPVRSPPPS